MDTKEIIILVLFLLSIFFLLSSIGIWKKNSVERKKIEQQNINNSSKSNQIYFSGDAEIDKQLEKLLKENQSLLKVNKELQEKSDYEILKNSYFKFILDEDFLKFSWEDLFNNKKIKDFYKSGIFAICIRTSKIDKNIPIYIGGSKNMAKSFLDIRKNINKGEWSPKYLKEIKSFLDKNNLSFEKIEFMLVEECSKKDLDLRQNFYISKFNSSVTGFN